MRKETPTFVILAICLLSFTRAQDSSVIEESLLKLVQTLNAVCARRYVECVEQYVNAHPGNVHYCTAVTEEKSCFITQGDSGDDTQGKCNENEYQKIKRVACMSGQEITDLQKIDRMFESMDAACSKCLMQNVTQSSLITLQDFCHLARGHKSCLKAPPNDVKPPCPNKQYSSLESLSCQGSGATSTHYSVLFLIAGCVFSKLVQVWN